MQVDNNNLKNIEEHNVNLSSETSTNDVAPPKKTITELAEILKLTSIVSNIGFIMLACIFIGFFLGFAFEKYILKEQKIFFVAIGILLGIIAGFLNVYKYIINDILKGKFKQ